MAGGINYMSHRKVQSKTEYNVDDINQYSIGNMSSYKLSKNEKINT